MGSDPKCLYPSDVAQSNIYISSVTKRWGCLGGYIAELDAEGYAFLNPVLEKQGINVLKTVDKEDLKFNM